MSQEIIIALIGLVGGIIGGAAVSITIEGFKRQSSKNNNRNKQTSKGDHSPNINTNNYNPRQ